MPTPTPAPSPANALFTQHPEELIKKVDRTKPETPATPEVAPVITPEAAAETLKEEQTLEELKKQLPSILFGDKPKEPDKPKEEPAKPADTIVPETPETPVEEPPKQTKVKKAAPVPDAMEIARETGKAIAESLRPALTPEVKPDPDVDPTTGLSSEDKDTYELFKVLEETDPRYKGRPSEFLSFVQKLSSYRKRWEKSHAGEAFNPSADDHEDFYTTNQPSFEESDLDKARIRLETRREVESRMSKEREDYQKRLTELEEKTVVPELERQAAIKSDKAVGQFVANITDEVLRKSVTEDSEKLRESDPLAFEILNNAASVVRQEVAELHNIIHRKNYFNAQNPMHKHLAQTIDRQEAAIKQLPAAQQVYDGKRFATRDEWASLTPTQRNQYWMLSEDDVVEMLSVRTSAEALKALDAERKRVDTLAAKYGYTKPAGAPVTPTPAAKPAATPAPARKAAPPAASSGGASPPTNAPAQGAEATVEKKLVGMLF